MKAAGKENPNPLGHITQHPSPWRGTSEQISLDYTGWEEEKLWPMRWCFFLTSPFIELIGTGRGEDAMVDCRKCSPSQMPEACCYATSFFSLDSFFDCL